MAEPLDELCGLLGVEREYEAAGELHRAPDATVRAVLAELGALLDRAGTGDDDVREALRAVRLERWRRLVEPVTVSWEGEESVIPVRLTGEEAARGVELRLVLEEGGVAERRVGPGELGWSEAVRSEGERFGPGRVPLPPLPPGRHEARLTAGGRRGRTFVLRAPTTTWDGPGEEGRSGDAPWRQWGVFLPLYALRTGRDRGVGDLGDLRALARWTADLGGAFVGTLPLLASFLGGPHGRGPVEPGPYLPASRLFWNELYLELEAAPGLEGAPEARRILASADHRAEAGRLRETRRAEHAAVMAHKRRVLEPLARSWMSDDGEGLRGALAAWAGERPDARAYARFRAGCEAPEASGGDVPAEAVAYHLYVQWAMDEQIRAFPGGADGEAGAGLYLDLPLGSHPLGYDVWRHPASFAGDASGGAPPDAFFSGGQDWGFPPLHPVRSREDGHAYFAACLRHHMEACRMLRIDHVMSLHRLFWVPRGGSPADGVYVRYPAEELWAVLCLESRRHRCEVVGEDLGTVPAEVPEEMERRKARCMWILPFETGPGTAWEASAEEHPPRARSVASLETHDLPPFAALWEEREGRSVGECGEEAGRDRNRALASLARSPARLVLVSLEDLWLEESPQNAPGTSGPHNWSQRAAWTLEELEDDAGVREALEEIDRLRRAPPSGREP